MSTYYGTDEDAENTLGMDWCKDCQMYHGHAVIQKFSWGTHCTRTDENGKQLDGTRAQIFKYPDEDWIR